MLETLLLPILMQLLAAPEEFYQQEYSDAVTSATQAADPANPEAIVLVLEALGEAGDDSALQALGELHQFGALGIGRDTKKACDYYEELDGRRADGLHNLATCYFSGDGRERNFEMARELYNAAAEAGFAKSFCALGNMYVRGQGGPFDAPEGIRLCRMTAVAGDADAQTDYGGYLLMGVGVERDPETARFILEQAAAQEQPNATFLLAQIYEKGDGAQQSNLMARQFYQQAYERGRADAAFRVGLMFARDGLQIEGEEMSVKPGLLREAIEWFQVATEIDPDEANRKQAAELIESSKTLIDSAS